MTDITPDTDDLEAYSIDDTIEAEEIREMLPEGIDASVIQHVQEKVEQVEGDSATMFVAQEHSEYQVTTESNGAPNEDSVVVTGMSSSDLRVIGPGASEAAHVAEVQVEEADHLDEGDGDGADGGDGGEADGGDGGEADGGEEGGGEEGGEADGDGADGGEEGGDGGDESEGGDEPVTDGGDGEDGGGSGLPIVGRIFG